MPSRKSQPEMNRHEEPGAPRWERWALALVLVLFVGWAATFLRVQPWGGGLDEPQHRAYFQVLAEDQRLPWLYQDADGQWVRYRDAHAMHPPAYYLALLPYYCAISHGSEEATRAAMRWASVVLGALTLLLAYPVCRRLLGGDRLAALTATAIIGLAPLYLLVSAIVNNDIASVGAYLLLLWLGFVRWGDETVTWKRTLVLGLVAGLAGLTKGTSEIAAFASGAALVWTGARSDGRAQAWLRTAAFAAVALAMVAPWHIRNEILYGSLSFIPRDGPSGELPTSLGILACVQHPNFPRVLRLVTLLQFDTLWAQKDWVELTFRPTYYAAMWALFLVGLVTLAIVRGRRREDLAPVRPWLVAFAGLAPLWGMAIWIACFIHIGWAEGGRYLLPLLPMIACTIVLPLRAIPERFALARFSLAAIVLLALYAVNALCYDTLVYQLIPWNGPPGSGLSPPPS